jgi:hypothetical protein
MKKAILGYLIGVLFICAGYAQDIIFFRDRTTVNAKITGLSERNISYKKYENQQGVLYTTSISKIDSVKWESGEVTAYPSFNPAIKKKGYEVGVEFAVKEAINGFFPSVNDKYHRPVISYCVGVSQMYRFNPYVALGGFVGLDYTDWYETDSLDTPLIPLYKRIRLKKKYAILMPLAGRIKIDFTKRKISPYFLLDCGYSFLIRTNEEMSTAYGYHRDSGFDLNAAIGFDIRLNNNSAFYCHGGYYLHQNQARIRLDTPSFFIRTENIHSFSFNIGYKF